MPVDRCEETSAGSGVFTRRWTKATVTLDTNTNKATIVIKTSEAAPSGGYGGLGLKGLEQYM